MHEDLNEMQPLTAVEASARLRNLRTRLESAGCDPLGSEEYRQAREVLNEAIGAEIDGWKSKHGFAGRDQSEGIA